MNADVQIHLDSVICTYPHRKRFNFAQHAKDLPMARRKSVWLNDIASTGNEFFFEPPRTQRARRKKENACNETLCVLRVLCGSKSMVLMSEHDECRGGSSQFFCTHCFCLNSIGSGRRPGQVIRGSLSFAQIDLLREAKRIWPLMARIDANVGVLPKRQERR
jgi:hypothetical protein